jgi:hypothetical protein
MDCIQTWVSILTGVLGIAGIGITLFQVYQIKVQLKNSALTNVLRLEAEMNSKKGEIDTIKRYKKIFETNGKLTDENNAFFDDSINTAVENFLYSVNRLCFCIKNEYFKEKDWKTEYRDYIKNVMETYGDKLDVATKYRNIKYIYEKWSGE